MPVPTLHAYSDHYFSAINGLARGSDGRLYFQPLKIFFRADMLFTVMGPTSAALTPEAVRAAPVRIRDRIVARELAAKSAFEIVHALRFEMLRTHEALLADTAARAAELEKSLLSIDPVRAETVLADLFELRHNLQTIRTNAAQTHELYVHLIDVLGSQETFCHLTHADLMTSASGSATCATPLISNVNTSKRCSICCRPGPPPSSTDSYEKSPPGAPSESPGR
jgi:hypothetical protein